MSLSNNECSELSSTFLFGDSEPLHPGTPSSSTPSESSLCTFPCPEDKGREQNHKGSLKTQLGKYNLILLNFSPILLPITTLITPPKMHRAERWSLAVYQGRDSVNLYCVALHNKVKDH